MKFLLFSSFEFASVENNGLNSKTFSDHCHHLSHRNRSRKLVELLSIYSSQGLLFCGCSPQISTLTGYGYLIEIANLP